MLSAFQKANIHINCICFDSNFHHPHINEVTFVPKKQSKIHRFFNKKQSFVEKVFDMYLLLGLSSLFRQNSHTFLKNCYLIVVPFEKLTKTSCLTALV